MAAKKANDKKSATVKHTKDVDTKAEPKGEPVTLAYDVKLLEAFVLGNITLGELEGVGKKVQYQIAEQGYKLLTQGKLDQAEKIFRGLISLDPFDSYFHTVYGSILQRRDQNEEAIEEYTRALKVNPFNATALANRGEIQFRMGNVIEAMQDIQAAIERDPQAKEPATNRARMLALALAKVVEENKEKLLQSLPANDVQKAAKSKSPATKKKTGKKKK